MEEHLVTQVKRGRKGGDKGKSADPSPTLKQADKPEDGPTEDRGDQQQGHSTFW